MNVIYKTKNISNEELKGACDLVNGGQQLSITLTVERLREVSFLVVAVSENKVIGASCIKKYGSVAEIGYTAVCANHRRKKIGLSMTEILITHALTRDIRILRAIVYESNRANRKKLEKLGFFEFSQYLSRSGEHTLCWYCHPLRQTKTAAQSMMKAFLKEKEESLSSKYLASNVPNSNDE